MKSSKCHYNICNTNIKIKQQIIGKCRCNYIFCNLHRLPECHNCSFDFNFDKDKFIKDNKCVKKKLEYI